MVHVTPIGETVQDIDVPLPEGFVLGVAPLESDIRVFAQPDQLADAGLEVGSLAVVHRIAFGCQPAAFTEGTKRNVVDFKLKIERAVGVFAFSCCHGLLPLPSSLA